MKTRTCAAALLACTLAACSDEASSPVSPVAPSAVSGSPAGFQPPGGPSASDDPLSAADSPSALRSAVAGILDSAVVERPPAGPARAFPPVHAADAARYAFHAVPAWFDWRHYAEIVHACYDTGGRCYYRSHVLSRPDRQRLVIYAYDDFRICDISRGPMDASGRRLDWIGLIRSAAPVAHSHFTGNNYAGGTPLVTYSFHEAVRHLRTSGSTLVIASRDPDFFGSETIAYALRGDDRGLIGFLLGRDCRMHMRGDEAFRSVFTHELGHSLGFAHTVTPGALMQPRIGDPPVPSATYNEFMHARLAFRAGRGRPIGRGFWPLSAPDRDRHGERDSPVSDRPILVIN